MLLLIPVPTLIVIAAALMGLGIHSAPGLPSMIMGALLLIAALGLFASIADCVRNRHIDFFWLSVATTAVALWSSVFLESLR